MKSLYMIWLMVSVVSYIAYSILPVGQNQTVLSRMFNLPNSKSGLKDYLLSTSTQELEPKNNFAPSKIIQASGQDVNSQGGGIIDQSLATVVGLTSAFFVPIQMILLMLQLILEFAFAPAVIAINLGLPIIIQLLLFAPSLLIILFSAIEFFTGRYAQ